MSAANPAPLFSIVREDDRYDVYEDSDLVDYGSTKYLNDHDEIELSDPYGEPAAIPLPQTHIDMDSVLNYSSGQQDRVIRMFRDKITLAIDYISSEKRRKLHQWMNARTKVLFTPGFGEKTVVGWRALDLFNYFDLTGKFTCTNQGSSTRLHYWDNHIHNGIMKEGHVSRFARICETPGGAGQLFNCGEHNNADPDHPTSSTVHGWTGQGTGITFGYNATGFGHTDCPGSLQVNMDSRSGLRWIYYDVDCTSATSGTKFASAVVFVRGYFGPSGQISLGKASTFGTVTGDVASIYPYQDSHPYDLSEWTPIYLATREDWSTTTAIRIQIVAGGSSGTHTIDFEVGPIAIFWDDTWSARMYHTHWKPYNASVDGAQSVHVPIADYQPTRFSWICSFFVPKDFSEEIFLGHIGFGRLSSPVSSAGLFLISNYTFGTNATQLSFWRDAATYINANIPGELRVGEINTACVVRANSYIALYLNGQEKVRESDISDQEVQIDDGTSFSFRIGENAYGNCGCPFLTTRLDREAWSEHKVAHIDRQLRDPGSIQPIIAARGRSYLIKAIPSVPRAAGGSTHWTGNLVLEQVAYNPDLADVTSREL